MVQPPVEMSRPGIPSKLNPDPSVEGFWGLGYSRLPDAGETKTIEKALPGFEGKTEAYGIGGSGP